MWSPEGARRTSGRWHLEKLAHWNGTLPPNQHFIEVTIGTYRLDPTGSPLPFSAPAVPPGEVPPGEESLFLTTKIAEGSRNRKWWRQIYESLTIPAGTRYEVVTADILPDWFTTSGTAARRFGHQWYEENRSAILLVPSVVARVERTVVINSRHADFNRLTAGLETPVWWDRRLFA